MSTRSVSEIPEALRRQNEEQQRDPEMVVNNLGRRVRVVVLWRQRDDDAEQWVYLERMQPSEFSYETVKQRWGGGAYRIRLFGAWNRAPAREVHHAGGVLDLGRVSAHAGASSSVAARGEHSLTLTQQGFDVACGEDVTDTCHRRRLGRDALHVHQAVVSWNEPTP